MKNTDTCLSIKRFSKRSPDFLETTGSSGTSPDTVKTSKKQENHRSRNDPHTHTPFEIHIEIKR